MAMKGVENIVMTKKLKLNMYMYVVYMYMNHLILTVYMTF